MEATFPSVRAGLDGGKSSFGVKQPAVLMATRSSGAFPEHLRGRGI